MRDDNGVTDDMSNVKELIDEISSLEEALREELVERIEYQMAWARLRYDEGGANYAERIEFTDFYFKLNDIIEELYRYELGGIAILKLEMERAYSDLKQNVDLYDSLDNEQL